MFVLPLVTKQNNWNSSSSITAKLEHEPLFLIYSKWPPIKVREIEIEIIGLQPGGVRG